MFHSNWLWSEHLVLDTQCLLFRRAGPSFSHYGFLWARAPGSQTYLQGMLRPYFRTTVPGFWSSQVVPSKEWSQRLLRSWKGVKTRSCKSSGVKALSGVTMHQQLRDQGAFFFPCWEENKHHSSHRTSAWGSVHSRLESPVSTVPLVYT